MSSITNDWIQKISHNKVRVFVFINNFKKKMQEYSMDEEFRSEPFQINGSRFTVDIYPSGVADVKGHVSVYLRNLTDWRVWVTYKISVPETKYAFGDEKWLFDSINNRSSAWGQPKFLPHNQRSKWISNDDSVLKIVVDLEMLCEEIQIKSDEVLTLKPTDFRIEKPGISNEDLKSFVSEKNQIIMKEIGNLRSMVMKENQDLRSMVAKLTSSVGHVSMVMKENQDLRSMVSKLTLSVEQLTEIVLDQKDDALKIEWPECPICKERIKKPMRLKQCGQGHIVCEACLRQETHCYTCQDLISGRPTALEHILSL